MLNAAFLEVSNFINFLDELKMKGIPDIPVSQIFRISIKNNILQKHFGAIELSKFSTTLFNWTNLPA